MVGWLGVAHARWSGAIEVRSAVDRAKGEEAALAWCGGDPVWRSLGLARLSGASRRGGGKHTWSTVQLGGQVARVLGAGRELLVGPWLSAGLASWPGRQDGEADFMAWVGGLAGVWAILAEVTLM
ncbi:hypothetical protein E2562_038416 [Oryza meyeriana var. granulata]|uniref:Uncharacterized protein n=1 Tax=Oryza meyeriana var. granulata TaxID=110450 RepID=A0A6G1FGR7_9ORYZ|nr:hypothetical protein E2562_038416 [Oryza meyeriana var. granulata]